MATFALDVQIAELNRDKWPRLSKAALDQSKSREILVTRTLPCEASAAASLGPSVHLGPDAQIINDNGFSKA